MAVNKELKNKVIIEIVEILKDRNAGKNDINLLRKRYPEIPANTFYRWVRKLKADTGQSDADIARNVKRRAAALGKAENKEGRINRRLNGVMPVAVDPDDIYPSKYLDVVGQIRRCVSHAEAVLAHCETKEGKIRNPKLYLQASKHILDSMKIAAYVSSQIMDVQNVEKFHQTILKRLGDRDPLLVENVLCDLEKLNSEYGLI